MNFHITKLREEHFQKGFFETLDNLCQEDSPLNIQTAKDLLEEIDANKNQFVYVAEDETGNVVSSVTLVIDPKFHRNFCKWGHVENVVTRKGFEGNNLATALIKHVQKAAKGKGCTKVVLSCSDANVSFYERTGFVKSSNHMKMYLDK